MSFWRQFWGWWRRNWGFGIFLIDVVLAMASLFRGVAGHYVNVATPAVNLWTLSDPYGIPIAGAPGWFFYPPGAGLYFFGLFAFLPDLLGQFLHMLVCMAVFCAGLRSFFRVLKDQFQFDMATSPYRHLIWLMFASETLGAIIAIKIDPLIVGITLWATSAVLTEQRVKLALFIAGIVASWKFHPVIVAGLILSITTLQRKWLYPILYGLGLAVGFLSPLLRLPYHLFVTYHEHLRSSLEEFVGHSWLSGVFQHLYGFFARAFHFNIPISVGNAMTRVLGALALAYLIWIFQRMKRQMPVDKATGYGVLLALGMGSGFVAMFSPFIQSNTYIVYLPLPLVFAVFVSALGWERRTVYWILGIAFFIVSLAYSDLCPRPLYRIFYYTGIKPLGVLLLFSGLLIAAWQMSSRRPLPQTSPLKAD